MLGLHIKQPAEYYSLAIDFAARLPAGETVASATVTSALGTVDSSSNMIASVAHSTTVVSFDIKEGTSGEAHKVTAKATANNGHVYEEDLVLQVQAQ